MRVLLVEDEELLAEAVAVGLRREGMAVDVALDGADALVKTDLAEYDVVILDRDLPLVHGDEVCQTLREAGRPERILMLTAAASVPDRIAGLHLGADDYLPKPFAFGELVARVWTLSRRTAPAPPVLRVGDIELDTARRSVTRAGRPVSLAPKEFAVLRILMSDPGRVFSAEELLERAWDEHADPFTNTVRVRMMNLRKKLGDPPAIETVPGAGYRVRQ